MSGDKLLGGPQAGIILGAASAIAKLRKNPFARAMRVDKLTLSALEATLRLYLEPERALKEIPVLAMLSAAPDQLEARANAVARTLREGWRRGTGRGDQRQRGRRRVPDGGDPVQRRGSERKA